MRDVEFVPITSAQATRWKYALLCCLLPLGVSRSDLRTWLLRKYVERTIKSPAHATPRTVLWYTTKDMSWAAHCAIVITSWRSMADAKTAISVVKSTIGTPSCPAEHSIPGFSDTMLWWWLLRHRACATMLISVNATNRYCQRKS